MKIPKIDTYSVLLGGGAAVVLWYLLADHAKPSYADPPASSGTGTSPLPPSLANLPPPPPPPQV